GGHLLWLGGPPMEATATRRESGRFARGERSGVQRRALGILAANEVPAEAVSRFVIPEEGGENPLDEAVVAALPREPSWALTVRLTGDERPARIGTPGPRERVLRPLVHGIGFEGEVASAPVVAIDRLEGKGAGGRSVFVSLGGRRLASIAPMLPALAVHA